MTFRRCFRSVLSRLRLPAVVLLAVGLMPRTGSPASPAAPRPRPPEPAIYRMSELNARDMARFNREKTFVLQPLGLPHQHGYHLPVGTDLVLAEALVQETAERLRQGHPDYAVLIQPLLPVGAGPSNEQGFIYSSGASVTLSPTTLRDLLFDWILNTAENSFWNYAVVSLHHDALHMQVIGEVCDFFNEVYNVRAVNVSGIVLADSAALAALGALASKHAGRPVKEPLFEMHGGLLETSLMMAVRPDLVEDQDGMADVPVASYEERTAAARKLGWPGYFGSPARAGPALGREALALLAGAHADVLSRSVAGIPWTSRPELGDALESEFWLREVVRGEAAYHARKRSRFDAWLRARPKAQEQARED